MTRENFYKDSEGKTKRLFYCTYCPNGPFKQDLLGKGLFYLTGATKQQICICKECYQIKFSSTKIDNTSWLQVLDHSDVSKPPVKKEIVVKESAPEPIPEPIPDPIPDPEPVSESVPDPVSDPIPESVPDPVSDPIPESVPEPVSESVPEPAKETEPIVKTLVEPNVSKKPSVAVGQIWKERDKRRNKTIELKVVDENNVFYQNNNRTIKISIHQLYQRWNKVS